MKSMLCLVSLFLVPWVTSLAQSRVSIAPTYWYTYNPYSSQVTFTDNGTSSQYHQAGHNVKSAYGLTARYHFTDRWDVSVGALYYFNTDYIPNPFEAGFLLSASQGGQVPILLNYRSSRHRLSPYFSLGTVVAKSTTFRDMPLQVDGVLGVGLTCRLGSAFSLLLQPTASYSFTRPVNSASFQFTDYHSYSWGAQAQMSYRF